MNNGLLTPDSQLRETVAIALRNLSNFFTSAIKITLVARHQGSEKDYMIFSEDSIEKVIETLQRYVRERKAPPLPFTPPTSGKKEIILP